MQKVEPTLRLFLHGGDGAWERNLPAAMLAPFRALRQLVVLQLRPVADLAVHDVALGHVSTPHPASRIFARMTSLQAIAASRYSRLCSNEDSRSSEVPERTVRLRMSISSTPSLITGVNVGASP